MGIYDVVSIIERSFTHLFYEKNLHIGNIEILLYFPTIGIAILEDINSDKGEDENVVNNLSEIVIEKELGADVIYLNTNHKNFNVGDIINDILLLAEFEPREIM